MTVAPTPKIVALVKSAAAAQVLLCGATDMSYNRFGFA
jgi:hypothetical protein